MKRNYDFLIVGAGLFGATFAFMAHRHGKKCLVVDRRPYPGGNIYCENIQGINVHKYGAHIFHTSNKRVWDFVNDLVPFNRYTNSPVAKAPNGKLYNLPFNMNTFYEMWGVETPVEAEKKLADQKKDALEQLQGRKPSNLAEQARVLVGNDIFEQLIREYTEKQWGRKCEELPADIIKRLPVRLTFDNNYFNDLYQGIPIGGYNRLVEKLLEGVEVRCNCDFIKDRKELEEVADTIVFTGAIDSFFGYDEGRLEYRTVSFDTELLPIPNYQGNAVINYTSSEVPFTRIIEHKHFELFGDKVYDIPVTVISKEFSAEWNPSLEPYYPVNDAKNNALYEKYKEKAEALDENDGKRHWIFGGRLAEYKYYDMDKVLARVLDKTDLLFGK